jgi:hypothetical protein
VNVLPHWRNYILPMEVEACNERKVVMMLQCTNFGIEENQPELDHTNASPLWSSVHVLAANDNQYCFPKLSRCSD